MIGYGIALALSVVSVVPFLEGHFLHRYFESFGKYLIFLSMGLWGCFIGASALTYIFWKYWRDIQSDR